MRVFTKLDGLFALCAVFFGSFSFYDKWSCPSNIMNVTRAIEYMS